VAREPGLSVRLKLTLSYAGFLMLAGVGLLAVVWVFLLRYVPEGFDNPGMLGPDRSDLVDAFAPKVTLMLALLLLFGLLGGWILAGSMLAPLTRITQAARLTADGSLSHRIRMEGRQDEFRELADAFDTMLARLEADVAEQQRFAANASHELRTPLAITQTLLEVARSDPPRDSGELVERLRFVNTRAIDLTEALLCSAVRTRGPSPGSTSTCPWSPRRRPRRCSPSRSSAASSSRPPVTWLPPSAPARCCSS
jgi:two-component system, OmpR family, sensor histidine kinase VanS